MKPLILLTFLFFYGISSAQQSYEDVVYLKNGSVIHGIVIEQVPNVSLKIKTKDQNVFVFKMEDVERITKEIIKDSKQESYNESEEDQKYYAGSEKSPALAIVLSALIPGLGQYYNGDILKGVIMDVLYIGGIVTILTLSYEEVSDSWSYWDSWNEEYQYYYSYYEEETAWLYIGAGVAIGTAIWSMIDAGISASNYNDNLRKNRPLSYGHMFESALKNNVILGFDLTPGRHGISGSITMHF